MIASTAGDRQAEVPEPAPGNPARQRRERQRAHRDRETVRGLWAELLAQLTHAAQECSQPDVIRRLKEMGVRSTGTAALNLAREYAHASHMATVAGVAPRPEDVVRRAQALMLRDDLPHDLDELATTYRRLLQALAPASGSRSRRWLEERDHVHRAQAEAIRRGP